MQKAVLEGLGLQFASNVNTNDYTPAHVSTKAGQNWVQMINNVIELGILDRDDICSALNSSLEQEFIEDFRLVSHLESWAEHVEGSGVFAKEVPLVGRTIGELIGLRGIISKAIIEPIENASSIDTSILDLIRNAISSSDNLHLKNIFGNSTVAEALGSGCLASLTGNLRPTEPLEYHISFDLDEAWDDVPISLGDELSKIGVDFSAGAIVDLHAGATIDMTLTYDPTPGLTAAEALTIEIDELSPQVSFGASDLNVGARVGFLGIGIEGGDIVLNAEADVVVNSGEPISLMQLLEGTSSDVLAIENRQAFLDASLPIQAVLNDIDLTGHAEPRITIQDSDLYSGAPPVIATEGFDELFDFKALDPHLVLSLLKQLRGWLNNVQESVLSDTTIPFTGDKTLGDVGDLAGAFSDKVISQLEDEEGNPKFATAQELLAELASLTGLSYDAETNELTYEVNFSHEFLSEQIPMDFDVDLADLVDVKVDQGQLNVDASANFGLVIGFDMSEVEEGSSIADHFFIRPLEDGSIVNASATLNANQVDATALMGFLGVGIDDADANISIQGRLELHEPTSGNQDGRISLSELSSGFSNLGSLLDVDLDGSVAIDLPLCVSEAMAGMLQNVPACDGDRSEADPRGRLSWADITDLDTLDVTFEGVDDILNFQQLSFMDIVNGLLDVAQQLSELEQFSFLDQDLPFVNRSVSDLLAFAQGFADKLTALEDNPVAAVQSLEQTIEQTLGLSDNQLSIRLDQVSENRALRFDLSIEEGFQQDFAINLDLATLMESAGTPAGWKNLTNLVDVGGEAKLSVDTNARFDLHFGIDLTNPLSPRPFLYDTTQLTLDAEFNGTDLEFRAAAGPLGLFVQQGEVTLGGDADPLTDDQAVFQVKLNDDDGDPIDLAQ